MSELEEFFAGFGDYVAQPDSAALDAWRAAHPEWEAAPKRLAIYGHHAQVAVTGLLATHYEKTQELLSPERWRELTLAYYARRPARDRYELNSLAEGFCDFLREQEDVPPAAVHVAAVEWACFSVYANGQDLPTPDWLLVNPSLLTLSLPYRVCGYLSGKRPQPLEGGEVVFVFRNPRTLRARYQSATDRALLALKLVVEGIPLAEAAQSADTTEAALRDVLREAHTEGLLIGEFEA